MCEYRYLVPMPEEKMRKLTLILLDCWQREYDERPYHRFKFARLMLEERLNRKFNIIEDFAIIVLFLKNRFLISLKLVGLNLTTYMVHTLITFVESMEKFKYIELKLMNLPTKFYQLMANSVDHMKVVELSLEGTPLNDNDIYCLRLFVQKSLSLQNLNVSSCNVTQYNFADLADGVHKSPKINTFKASHLLGLHLYLDTDKIAHIVSSLLWQNKLQDIELENCGFVGQDIEIIAEYLYNKCCKLRKLNLALNKIGPDGVLQLFKAISSSGTLKYLNINGCGLGSYGGYVVAQYLSSCCNLESLKLQHNNIGAEVINMILLCMKKSCELKKLHLFGNSYNPCTGDTLKRLLESNILPQNYIDITVTFDNTIPGYRVIPWLA